MEAGVAMGAMGVTEDGLAVEINAVVAMEATAAPAVTVETPAAEVTFRLRLPVPL